MLLDLAFDPRVGGQASPASAGEAFFSSGGIQHLFQIRWKARGCLT